jgi:lipoprotein-anchoring transpeptidase ErfK/SrfK
MNKKMIILATLLILILITVFAFLMQINGTGQQKTNYKKLIHRAEALADKGQLRKAKAIYRQILNNTQDVSYLEEIQNIIEGLNIKMLFSATAVSECSTVYKVKPLDNLTKIANKFNTTVSLIKKTNNLKSDVIRPGQELKVNKCPFSIVVDKSQNVLFLKRNGELVKSYLVSTGKNNSTPVGEFIINEKIKNPTWFKTGAIIPPDSPENALGSRWMGLNTEGIGIHGNRDVNEIGKQVTQGCVRMHNEDVEELFTIVPVKTKVTIIN